MLLGQSLVLSWLHSGPAPLWLCCAGESQAAAAPVGLAPQGGIPVGRGMAQGAGPRAAGNAEGPSHPLSVS